MNWINITTILANITVVFSALFALYSWKLDLINRKKYEIAEEYMLIVNRLSTIMGTMLNALLLKDFPTDLNIKMFRSKLSEHESLINSLRPLQNYISIFFEFDTEVFNKQVFTFAEVQEKYFLFIKEISNQVLEKKSVNVLEVKKTDVCHSKNLKQESDKIINLLKPYTSDKIIKQKTITICILAILCLLLSFVAGYNWALQTKNKTPITTHSTGQN